MNKTVIRDERIELEKLRIASAAFGILVLGMIADIFYKAFTNAPFNSFKGELILLALVGGFYTCETTRKGIVDLASNTKEKKKFKTRYLINNTVLALGYAVIDIFQGAVQTNSDKVGLVMGMLAFIAVGYGIDVFIMRKSNKNANADIDGK